MLKTTSDKLEQSAINCFETIILKSHEYICIYAEAIT